MMAGLVKLLGETLAGHDGSEVATSTLAGAGKVVGLYFSAHWCPPCRAFTPQLAAFYKKWKQSDKKDLLDIVFVSSDREQSAFNEYFDEMPWLALPYTERSLKEKLSRSFKVSGIPTLVMLDAETGKAISSEGRRIVAQDPEGENFPWKPKPVAEVLGETFIRKNGDEVSKEAFDDCVLGVYFSAHWCPPCRSFTPQLIKTYNALKEQGKKFEIIFCSSDRDEASFKEYFDTMPWLAVPHGDKRKAALSTALHVSGIPKFVVLNEQRGVITENGRAAIASDPDGAEFPWTRKPLNVLTDRYGQDLNEEICLLYFTDGVEANVEDAQKLLLPLAEKEMAEQGDDAVRFFVTLPKEEITESLATFVKAPSERPLLMILDCGGQCVYQSSAQQITAEVVATFLSDFRGKKLTPRPLS